MNFNGKIVYKSEKLHSSMPRVSIYAVQQLMSYTLTAM